MRYDELLEMIMPELKARLSEARMAHSRSVAKTAADLARIYGVDVQDAYLAGMLHDWDKDLSEEELFEHADKYRVKVPKNRQAALATLHGPCGAADLKSRYKEIPQEVLSAIEKHTVGAGKMSDLDKVVYIADMIEPLRTKKSLESLRLYVGTASLDELFFECHLHSIEVLLKKRRHIDPVAIEVYNNLVDSQSGEKRATVSRKTLKLGQ